MPNFNITMRLEKFIGAEKITHDGQEGVFIPFSPNNIFASNKKGFTCYMSTIQRKPNPKHMKYAAKISKTKKYAEELERMGYEDSPFILEMYEFNYTPAAKKTFTRKNTDIEDIL